MASPGSLQKALDFEWRGVFNAAIGFYFASGSTVCWQTPL